MPNNRKQYAPIGRRTSVPLAAVAKRYDSSAMR